MDNKTSYEPPVAVLQVHNEKELDYTTETSTTISSSSSSSRSSLSSFDSNHDHTAPLELGLVINALQTSLTEQEEEEEEPVQTSTATIQPMSSPQSTSSSNTVTSSVSPTAKFGSKGLKREEAVIVDYELDHGVTNTNTATNRESSTTGSANLIVLDCIDPKSVKPNNLTPREQEKAVILFMHLVWGPCQQATDNAIKVLMSTYNLASAQIGNSTKRNVGGTVIQYFTSYCNSIKFSRGSGVPTNVTPVKPKALETHKVNTIPNGVLRAHVVKAEACLQIAILYLLQETITGYIKCGLNLRRAYSSYSIVWQEYKRTGQLHNEYIDRDTISGIQFGIGAVHLVLSSLPQKILRTVAAFGWKADKHLGFALLKLCLEDRRARASMSSVMLLAYYTTLTSLCPQILADQYTQPAIETLLDAQKTFPNSAIFLYFAGKTSRLARNLELSTQSFVYAIETSKNEWAEVEVLHMCSYEIGFNHMMKNQWAEATAIFQTLFKERYWSQPIFKYLTGACLDMMGQRTEAILAFAEIPQLMKSNSNSKNSSTYCIEQYILRKVKLFQSSGYQDMDMTMCALEYMYLFNAYEFMEMTQLEQNLALTDYALSRILEAEKLEYGIRTTELLPETPPPEYYDQRGALLLIKASILNAMGRYQESVIHLNWIVDHKNKIIADKWVVPFAYWEVGMTSWNLDQRVRGKGFWEIALSYTNYDFEYRLAMRVNLALTRAAEIGISDKRESTPLNQVQEQQCDSVAQSQCNSDMGDESDFELEGEEEDNGDQKQQDDRSSTKSLDSDSTANTENLPDEVAAKIEIEQVVDQRKLSSENNTAVAAQH
ncbi:tetratricopeptide repeat protein 39A isoform X2 [Mucor ambiguus]|uniref:Tetratricopeptide repeat protein 39A isoform X2 n=1 Tax=Mucor ambiguus TaxID=91626 RepID=A0A0C9MD62_9FUNG|nr:tetratricopeptide repeat protein 39A isoform X2 [Mucor ambiguus]